jgi:RHS repeat-associated protein
VTVKRYDAAGRLAFQSYPMASLSSYASTTLQGSKSVYDALGRVTQVQQDSELGVLTTTTAYQSGLKIKVTDPRGNATTTSYLAYDQPTTDWPVAIARPGGVYTDIARDPYGKPTSITRRNSAGTTSLTRSYTYNANQELCRQVEPETGATLMGYDSAGNLSWTAAGLTAGTACSASGTTTAILARKVVRGYDARNRLKTLTFADSDGNQVWTYAPDGLPTNIVTTMLSDGRIVTHQYSYNRRRLLATETQKLTNWGTYAVTHQYNANGHLANLVYPAIFQGSVVDYAPNALGQPTKAGTFASAVTYFPNGAIKSFTYGNGLKHTLTQNLRGLPDTSCDFASSCNTGAVLNDGYDYDANGNVAAISDGRTGNAGDRSMTYDALDRLTQVVAPGMFGTATYSYDVLDNLTRTKVTGGNQPRDHYYCYDATWRLATVRTGSCTGTTAMSLGYDVQGNLANRNGIAYTFDYGNRLRQVAGQENQYLYDGHGRRVASNRLINGSSVRRSIYGLDGKLLFVQDQGEAKRKEYIYLGGSLLAERSLPNTGAATPVSIRYQHTDALGSPVAVSDESKVVVERTAYEPYGWAANRASRNGPGFTGHHEDAATGLVYMQQRYYDAMAGRFLSVDPVTTNSTNGSNFNRYWYANNNPYKFTDPDGRKIKVEIVRDKYSDMSVTSTIKVTSDKTDKSFEGFALEDTRAGPRSDKDPIDPGNYDAHIRNDGSKGFRIELKGVPKFTNVQIHAGNTVTDVEGCFAAGTTRSADRVGSSKSAMKSIQSIVKADGSGDIRVEVYGSSTPPKSPAPLAPELHGVP